MKGSVYKSVGSRYIVKTSSGDFLECLVKGKLRTKNIRSTSPVVVGDEVVYEIETSGDEVIGVIKEVLPRKNYIIRKAVNLSKETHIIASNIDQAFLIITLFKPTTTTVFIDRFLLAANSFGIPCILVFNKIDDLKEQDMSRIENLKKLYQHLDYTCIETSATQKIGIENLKTQMQGKTSLFSGHSGVGKSTLINVIQPNFKLKTAEVSYQHALGQHTTTFAEKRELSFGGSIIDSPGIKGLGIVQIEKEEIARYFPDFFKTSQHCKYHNCIHIKEPQCAVKQAVKEKHIAQSRYQSYLQIMENEDSKHRTG